MYFIAIRYAPLLPLRSTYSSISIIQSEKAIHDFRCWFDDDDDDVRYLQSAAKRYRYVDLNNLEIIFVHIHLKLEKVILEGV